MEQEFCLQVSRGFLGPEFRTLSSFGHFIVLSRPPFFLAPPVPDSAFRFPALLNVLAYARVQARRTQTKLCTIFRLSLLGRHTKQKQNAVGRIKDERGEWRDKMKNSGRRTLSFVVFPVRVVNVFIFLTFQVTQTWNFKHLPPRLVSKCVGYFTNYTGTEHNLDSQT